MKRALSALALAASLGAACGGEDAARRPPDAPRPAAADAGAAPDPLGPKPEPGEPAAYTPPVPVHYKRPGGTEVWLLERHALPIVSMQVVVPAGAAYDPEGKGGLALTTANMLDEGAGARGPLELSREIDRLGATLRTGAYADYGFAQLTVLKKNLTAAAALFGDVVSKPQLSAVEFKRVHDLWRNALRARQSEPDAVAGVVVARKVYPAGHPYAHPSDGTLASAAAVTLADVKKFYADRWRPDRAKLVVVGDVTRAELDAVLDQALASWKAPASPPPSESLGVPAPFVGRPAPASVRRVVVVDRADAPQSVIAVARPGVSAFDEESAVLTRVNAALGGSFTSRLNQNLREEHGWSYGARSRFSFTRMRGVFVAQAAVHTEHTGDALQAMLSEIGAMAKDGLTDDEVDKTKQLARADLVEAFETVQAAAARLGRSAGVGHGPDHEAAASHVAARADKAALKRYAAQYLDLDAATIVIVGPRAKIKPQLEAIGITAIESSGPEGQ
ncbi:MAG: insulinase family protein [Labilithrix sp.]|nr:insulinase family protein [Labilithrix sp.]